jgi:holo-[acyl-carrier protein] synthase
VIAVGTDILQINRIGEVEQRLGERFMRRILTPSEQHEYRASALPERLLAKRFCAKEAVAKALGTGIGRGVSWQDIEITHDDYGAPRVRLSGGAADRLQHLGGQHLAISLADEHDYVVAFAVLA